jgi:hypothetical protein
MSLSLSTIATAPICLARLGSSAPPTLSAIGNQALLTMPKTALFCSTRCPGRVILPTYDQAAKWRDAGRCVISGFHSPVEKECLQILLRGDAPVILCPARGMLERLPAQWAIAVAGGRMTDDWPSTWPLTSGLCRLTVPFQVSGLILPPSFSCPFPFDHAGESIL